MTPNEKTTRVAGQRAAAPIGAEGSFPASWLHALEKVRATKVVRPEFDWNAVLPPLFFGEDPAHLATFQRFSVALADAIWEADEAARRRDYARNDESGVPYEEARAREIIGLDSNVQWLDDEADLEQAERLLAAGDYRGIIALERQCTNRGNAAHWLQRFYRYSPANFRFAVQPENPSAVQEAPRPTARAREAAAPDKYVKRIRKAVPAFKRAHHRWPSKNEICDAVTGKKANVLAAINDMVAAGELIEQDGGYRLDA